MDVEGWNSLFKSIAMWSGLVTALAAGAGWWTESIVRTRDTERLRIIGKDIADAKAGQAAAETRLKSVEGETAKQQERAANAERSLLELKQRVAPRRVTPEQRAQFIVRTKSLAKSPGSVRVLTISDAEAVNLSRDLEALFKEAGFIVKWEQVIGTSGHIPQAVTVSLDDLPERLQPDATQARKRGELG